MKQEIVIGRKCEGDSGSYLIDHITTLSDKNQIENQNQKLKIELNKIITPVSLFNIKKTDKTKSCQKTENSKNLTSLENSEKLTNFINVPKKTLSQRISARLAKRHPPSSSTSSEYQSTPMTSSHECQSTPMTSTPEYQSTPMTLSPEYQSTPMTSSPSQSLSPSQYQSHLNISDLLILEELTRRESLLEYIPPRHEDPSPMRRNSNIDPSDSVTGTTDSLSGITVSASISLLSGNLDSIPQPNFFLPPRTTLGRIDEMNEHMNNSSDSNDKNTKNINTDDSNNDNNNNIRNKTHKKKKFDVEIEKTMNYGTENSVNVRTCGSCCTLQCL